MDKNLLTEFCGTALLDAVKGDSDFKLIQGAAVDVGDFLLKNPGSISSFVIAALDSRVKASDPVHKVVGDIAKAKWNTIQNALGAAPVQVYRAIILGALEVLVAKKPEVIPAIVLSSKNISRTYYGTNEAEAILHFLQKLASQDLSQTKDVWVSLPPPPFAKLNAKGKGIDVKNEISVGLYKAAGPTDAAGKPVEGGNTSYATDSVEWTNHFVTQASATLAKAIAAGFDINSNETRTALESLKEGIQKLVNRDAKCELLWLKESAFSLSAQKSYREMTETEVIFYSVIDVSKLVGNSGAPSVEWFLHDIVEKYFPGKGDVETVIDGFGPLINTLSTPLETSAGAVTGRRTLWEVGTAPSEGSFVEQTGLPSGFEETYPNLARRLFRDVQSLKIIASLKK